jgi:hypothetical protein
LRESSLHPKFYSPIFFWDVESSSNYAKKLKLTGIAATTLVLVIASEKRFPPPNFNLKIVRIQRGSGSWMLLDALLHC